MFNGQHTSPVSDSKAHKLKMFRVTTSKTLHSDPATDIIQAPKSKIIAQTKELQNTN